MTSKNLVVLLCLTREVNPTSLLVLVIAITNTLFPTLVNSNKATLLHFCTDFAGSLLPLVPPRTRGTGEALLSNCILWEQNERIDR